MPPTDSGATKEIEGWHDSTPPPEDEEATLSAKLHKLKLAEEALTKTKCVEELKTAIAEAEKRLANLQLTRRRPVGSIAFIEHSFVQRAGWDTYRPRHEALVEICSTSSDTPRTDGRYLCKTRMSVN